MGRGWGRGTVDEGESVSARVSVSRLGTFWGLACRIIALSCGKVIVHSDLSS